MKITSLTKKLGAALVAGGLMIPSTIEAASLNTNLISDPGFEDVNATAGAYGALQLNSWSDGTHTGYTYASGQYDNGGPLVGGGARYFSSNQTTGAGTDADAPGQITESIDLSTGDSAAVIASGTARYSFGAFFTTYDTDEDFGALHLEFLDAGAGSLGADSVGPLVNEGGWTAHTGGGLVPAGTASVLVSVFGTAVNGGPDGYIDNTSFSISEIPEPTSMLLAGLGLAGVGLTRRRNRD